MTEYDYSPEAYERYLATQNRIANWVDHTEQHRPQFENALSSVPAASSSRPGHTPYDAHRPSKRSPAPPSPPHRSQYQQPRQLFIHPPSPASDSSDGYGHGPGPMPLSTSPMMMYPPQQPAYLPMGQPLASPPPMLMHSSYTAAPHHKSSHHRHRSPHSQQIPAYYSMVSPPVSAGYQYTYPPVTAGGHPGYFVVQPQHHASRPMPLMSNLAELPRSAPPNSTFPALPTPAGPPNSGGYFQPHPTSGGSNSAFASFASTPYSPPPQGVDAWSYGAASPSHSVVSGSTGTIAVTSSSQRHYFPNIPQYQGIHSAMASPPYLPGPSHPGEPFLVPQHLHQRVYDLQSGNRYYLRRSVG